MKAPMLVEVETVFSCPMCGGGYWGTSNCTGPVSTWIGHCHDQFGLGCKFSWPRRNDRNYFVRVTREKLNSPKKKRKAVAR